MKNKEIEELLNNFQEVLDNPKYTDEMYNGKLIEFDKTYDLEQDEIKLLLSYIEQLEKENKQLKEDSSGFYRDAFMNRQELVDMLRQENEQLENNNNALTKLVKVDEEKLNKASNIMNEAIEYINKTVFNEKGYINFCYELENILKGDSDE